MLNNNSNNNYIFFYEYKSKPVSIIQDIICYNSTGSSNQYFKSFKSSTLLGEKTSFVYNDCYNVKSDFIPIKIDEYIDKNSYIKALKDDSWFKQFYNITSKKSENQFNRLMNENNPEIFFNILGISGRCFVEFKENPYDNTIIYDYNEQENKIYLRKTIGPFDSSFCGINKKYVLGLKVTPTKEFEKKLKDALSKKEVVFFH